MVTYCLNVFPLRVCTPILLSVQGFLPCLPPFLWLVPPLFGSLVSVPLLAADSLLSPASLCAILLRTFQFPATVKRLTFNYPKSVENTYFYSGSPCCWHPLCLQGPNVFIQSYLYALLVKVLQQLHFRIYSCDMHSDSAMHRLCLR